MCVCRVSYNKGITVERLNDKVSSDREGLVSHINVDANRSHSHCNTSFPPSLPPSPPKTQDNGEHSNRQTKKGEGEGEKGMKRVFLSEVVFSCTVLLSYSSLILENMSSAGTLM